MSNNEQQNTFNWGKGLAVVIIIFVCAVLSIVGFLVTLDYEMVTKNHYEEAVNYQEHIDKVEQANALQEPIKITLSKGQKSIKITFPPSIDTETLEGKIELYRPSDSSLDRQFDLEINHGRTQQLATDTLINGKWLIKVSWTTDKKSFFTEKTLFI